VVWDYLRFELDESAKFVAAVPAKVGP
jgi:hypothetical protein